MGTRSMASPKPSVRLVCDVASAPVTLMFWLTSEYMRMPTTAMTAMTTTVMMVSTWPLSLILWLPGRSALIVLSIFCVRVRLAASTQAKYSVANSSKASSVRLMRFRVVSSRWLSAIVCDKVVGGLNRCDC